MPVPESPGQTSNDKTTDRPGIVHAHTKIDLPFSWRWKIYFHNLVVLSKLTCANLHGPYEGCSVAGDGHGASDPPREDETPVERHERGDHSKHAHCHLMMIKSLPQICLMVATHRSSPDCSLPAESVRDKSRAERTQSKAWRKHLQWDQISLSYRNFMAKRTQRL